jgi:hypothetical protein
LSNNCTRFLENTNSPNFCKTKINNFITSHNLRELYENEKAEIIELKNSSGKNLIDIVRGHFLFSLILKYVSYYISQYRKEKSKISNDALFSLLINNLNTVLETNNLENMHYKSQASKIS